MDSTAKHELSTRGLKSIPGEPLLSPGLLLRAMQGKVARPSGEMRWYAYARYALANFLKERHVTRGILYVPSYICAEATFPLKDIGQTVRYYPVGDHLEPDWDWLETNLDAEARAFLLVHYFGFPNAVQEALEFSQRHSLLLVEDCAHSFLTKVGGETIGSFGDGGIYSYRKVLPVPNGAGLVTKGREEIAGVRFDGPGLGRPPYLEIARQLVKHRLYRSGFPKKMLSRVGRTASGINGAGGRSNTSPTTRLSGIILAIIRALEPSFDEIVALRRTHYQQLLSGFSQFPEVTLPYPSLMEGVCPYLFPVLLSARDRALRELRAQGIPCHAWPVLPNEVSADPRFEVTHRYSRQILAFPVHQDLNSAQVEEMIRAFRAVRSRTVDRA